MKKRVFVMKALGEEGAIGNGNAVEVVSLVKRYGDLAAVGRITFNVRRGEIFAFLGPNGAGKTTTVEILECLKMPTSGEARVLGYDVRNRNDQKEIRKRIGVLPENFSAFDRLTVQENIELFGKMFNSHLDVDDLIRMVNLEEKRKELFANLSSGLKQRLGIAVALVNDPEVVFLDEPTSGLDPKARHDTWDVIRDLKKEGKTVFLTTHYMEEAQELADTVAIIDHGKIIAKGTPEKLIAKYGGTSILVVKKGGETAQNILCSKFSGVEAMENGDIYVPLHKETDVMEAILALGEKKVGVKELEIRKPSLERVFLNLAGKRVTEEGEVI